MTRDTFETFKNRYIDHIVDECHVDYYLSANDGAKFPLPHRMLPVHEIRSRYVKNCRSFILDSSFQDESIGNKQTLDTAHEVGADFVVLEDVFQDCLETVEKLKEGLRLYQKHPCQATPILPLQQPYKRCWRELGKPTEYPIALGGLKDYGGTTKLRATRNFRRLVGPDVHLHGLGFGTPVKLVRGIRSDPDLLDSLDSYAPVADAGRLEYWAGSERSTPRAVHGLAYYLEACRRMSPLAEDPKADVPNPNPGRQTKVGEHDPGSGEGGGSGE